MQGQSVTWTERIRSERHTSEVTLSLKMEPGDNITTVIDKARAEVKAALRRSQNEAMLEATDEEIPF